MGSSVLLAGADGFWSVDRDGDVAILRMERNVLGLAADLARFSESLKVISMLGMSDPCRAVLMLGAKGAFSPNRWRALWQQRAAALGQMVMARHENAFLRIARATRSSMKPYVIALQGDVALPFLGMALSCDARIIGADTVFHNCCQQFGVPPVGGLGCFLPLYVGFRQAMDILLHTSQLDAARAFGLGLADQIAPPDDLEREAIAAAHRWADVPTETFAPVKRLLNAHLGDMDVHFAVEMQEVQRAMAHHGQA